MITKLKQQAAKILQEKISDICTKIPAFDRELDRRRGRTVEGKDYCCYVFKNGSTIHNLAAAERTRGMRRHSLIMEECVSIDGDILHEVLIPTLSISRQCEDGTTQESEVLNKSQLYITTAGYKGTFAYDKLIDTLVWQIVRPEKAMVIGGSWRLPAAEGLYSKSFIDDQKEAGTFNEAAFGREYKHKLYSLNFVNCWNTLRAYIQPFGDEQV